jgi:hypothetical protein
LPRAFCGGQVRALETFGQWNESLPLTRRSALLAASGSRIKPFVLLEEAQAMASRKPMTGPVSPGRVGFYEGRMRPPGHRGRADPLRLRLAGGAPGAAARSIVRGAGRAGPCGPQAGRAACGTSWRLRERSSRHGADAREARPARPGRLCRGRSGMPRSTDAGRGAARTAAFPSRVRCVRTRPAARPWKPACGSRPGRRA